MNTLLIEVKDEKAYEALQELEKQNVIKVLDAGNNNGEKKMKASSFRGGLQLTDEQYKNFQNHVTEIRNEWEGRI